MGQSGSKQLVAEKASGYTPPENDYQLVFEAIKGLEHTLMTHFESSGDHLHEMISTTSHKLPLDLIIDMRALATVRNNLAHEYSCDKLPDRDDFISKYVKCVRRLDEEVSRLKVEEEIFYKEVVEKHREQNPRPAFMDDDESTVVGALSKSTCIACF